MKTKGYIVRCSDNLYAAIGTNSPISLNSNKDSWRIEGAGKWEREIDDPHYEGALEGITYPIPKEVNKPIPVMFDFEEGTCTEVMTYDPEYEEMMQGIIATPEETLKKTPEESLKPGHVWMVVDSGGKIYLGTKDPKPFKWSKGWSYSGYHFLGYWVNANEEYPDLAFPLRTYEDEPIQIINNKVIWQR